MRRSRPVNILHLGAAIWLFMVLVPAWQSAAMASVISWNDAAGGVWSDPLNWSPNQVPGALDDAIITLDGTYTVTLDADANVASLVIGASSGTQTFSILGSSSLAFAGASSVGPHGVLSMSGGALMGGGTLTIDGGFNWSGGSMTGSGVISANAGIAITGAPVKELDGWTLNTAGTVSWTGTGAVRLGNGAVVNNAGTWDAQSSASLGAVFSAPRTFNNLGIFRKSAGGTTSVVPR